MSLSNTEIALKKLADSLKCSVCGNIAEDTHVLGACAHFFCGRCTRRLAGKNCPKCTLPTIAKEATPIRTLRFAVDIVKDLLQLLPVGLGLSKEGSQLGTTGSQLGKADKPAPKPAEENDSISPASGENSPLLFSEIRDRARRTNTVYVYNFLPHPDELARIYRELDVQEQGGRRIARRLLLAAERRDTIGPAIGPDDDDSQSMLNRKRDTSRRREEHWEREVGLSAVALDSDSAEEADLVAEKASMDSGGLIPPSFEEQRFAADGGRGDIGVLKKLRLKTSEMAPRVGNKLSMPVRNFYQKTAKMRSPDGNAEGVDDDAETNDSGVSSSKIHKLNSSPDFLFGDLPANTKGKTSVRPSRLARRGQPAIQVKAFKNTADVYDFPPDSGSDYDGILKNKSKPKNVQKKGKLGNPVYGQGQPTNLVKAIKIPAVVYDLSSGSDWEAEANNKSKPKKKQAKGKLAKKVTNVRLAEGKSNKMSATKKGATAASEIEEEKRTQTGEEEDKRREREEERRWGRAFRNRNDAAAENMDDKEPQDAQILECNKTKHAESKCRETDVDRLELDWLTSDRQGTWNHRNAKNYVWKKKTQVRSVVQLDDFEERVGSRADDGRNHGNDVVDNHQDYVKDNHEHDKDNHEHDVKDNHQDYVKDNRQDYVKDNPADDANAHEEETTVESVAAQQAQGTATARPSHATEKENLRTPSARRRRNVHLVSEAVEHTVPETPEAAIAPSAFTKATDATASRSSSPGASSHTTTSSLASQESKKRGGQRRGKSTVSKKRKVAAAAETNLNDSTLSAKSSISPRNLAKRNGKGETVLQQASIKGNLELVRELLMNGADPNTMCFAGWTPLHEAVQRGFVDISRELLDHGAAIDAGGDGGVTALEDAVQNDQTGCVELLLARGANPHIRTAQGSSLLDITTSAAMKKLLKTAQETSPKTLLPPQPSQLVLLTTSLDREKCAQVQRLATVLHARVVDTFTKQVTHLISAVNEEGQCARTIKYMQAILTAKWIVTYQWVETCLEYNSRISEEPFEVPGCSTNISNNAPARSRTAFLQQMPPLFEGCHVYFQGEFSYPSPEKETLIELVSLGGAVVLEDKPTAGSVSHSSQQMVPFHALPQSGLEKCSHFIVFDSRENKKTKKGMVTENLARVDCSWVLDSIAAFELLEIDDSDNK